MISNLTFFSQNFSGSFHSFLADLTLRALSYHRKMSFYQCRYSYLFLIAITKQCNSSRLSQEYKSKLKTEAQYYAKELPAKMNVSDKIQSDPQNLASICFALTRL